MKRQCRCSPHQIETYRQRISDLFLDRIDIHGEVPLVDFRELSSNAPTGEKSAIRTLRSFNHGAEESPGWQPVGTTEDEAHILIALRECRQAGVDHRHGSDRRRPVS